MAISVESSSPSLMKGPSSSPIPMGPSPSPDQHIWSTLRRRVDTLLENRKSTDQTEGADERAKRMKEDALLLIRGFDSVSSTLSQLSNNLESALQGARDLANPPTLTEILHCNLEKAKSEENHKPDEEDVKGGIEKRALKRKFESQECSEDPNQGTEGDDDSKDGSLKGAKELGKLKKAKNLAVSMATKAAAFARELKSLKSDLCAVQERCAFLEEENRKLRIGVPEVVIPPQEEDDLVRLQLEALLAEKSRLANENANLSRENQCLREQVEYHQFASEDISASYENLLRGMGMSMDFTSLPDEQNDVTEGGGQLPSLSQDLFGGISKTLDDCYDED